MYTWEYPLPCIRSILQLFFLVLIHAFFLTLLYHPRNPPLLLLFGSVPRFGTIDLSPLLHLRSPLSEFLFSILLLLFYSLSIHVLSPFYLTSPFLVSVSLALLAALPFSFSLHPLLIGFLYLRYLFSLHIIYFSYPSLLIYSLPLVCNSFLSFLLTSSPFVHFLFSVSYHCRVVISLAITTSLISISC